MGLYTVYNDQIVDAAIASDLAHIVDFVTAALPVKSVILGGGFGRGEGSVLKEERRVVPVNDYDIFLVLPDDCAVELRPLQKELAYQLNIRLVDLIPLKESSLGKLPPTQFNYDLKYGGQVVWGYGALDDIPAFDAKAILFDSARLVVLNRLICAIEAFSVDYERHLPGEDALFFLVNQTGKVISACVESLLIKSGNYHFSYAQRQKIFSEVFPEREQLKRLNDIATTFKLMPTRTVNFDAVRYWHDAIREYVMVLCEILTSARHPSVCSLYYALLSNPRESFTNNQVERVELLLLLYKTAPLVLKPFILLKAHIELASMTRQGDCDGFAWGWEPMRITTSRLWHELYH